MDDVFIDYFSDLLPWVVTDFPGKLPTIIVFVIKWQVLKKEGDGPMV